jgi:hypothetical protein
MVLLRAQEWLIASGDTESSAIDKEHLDLVGADLPTLTGTNLSFLTSTTLAGTYAALSWEGDAVSFPKSGGPNLRWDPSKFAGDRFIKIVSDATETVEGGRTITPKFRDFT